MISLFASKFQFNVIWRVLGSIGDTKFWTSDASGRNTEVNSFDDSYSVIKSFYLSFKSAWIALIEKLYNNPTAGLE